MLCAALPALLHPKASCTSQSQSNAALSSLLPAGFGAQVAYCASKGALLPLSKSLAVAWGKDK